MKVHIRWLPLIEFLARLGVFIDAPRVLPPPSPELVARAAEDLARARLDLQLRQADAVLGVALGSAWRDVDGSYIAKVERRWLS